MDVVNECRLVHSEMVRIIECARLVLYVTRFLRSLQIKELNSLERTETLLGPVHGMQMMDEQKFEKFSG